MYNLSPSPRQQFFDTHGPLIGGKLYTYESGTTTFKPTYQDQEGTENTNPVILDTMGSCRLLLSVGAYTFVLKTADDESVFTEDNIQGIGGDLESLDASEGNINYELAGKTIVEVVKIDSSANAITLSDSTGNTVNGGASYILTQYREPVKLTLIGTDWITT